MHLRDDMMRVPLRPFHGVISFLLNLFHPRYQSLLKEMMHVELPLRSPRVVT